MPETQHIERHLQNFTDQHLANLQAATEDGTLVFWNSCGCLNHYHQGDYARTKATVPEAVWAEKEFCHLSDTADEEREQHKLFGVDRDFSLIQRGDAQRRERMLPLIHAEWRRRAQPIPVTFAVPVKEEALVA